MKLLISTLIIPIALICLIGCETGKDALAIEKSLLETAFKQVQDFIEVEGEAPTDDDISLGSGIVVFTSSLDNVTIVHMPIESGSKHLCYTGREFYKINESNLEKLIDATTTIDEFQPLR